MCVWRAGVAVAGKGRVRVLPRDVEAPLMLAIALGRALCIPLRRERAAREQAV